MKKLLLSLVLFMFYANPTMAVEPVFGEMGSNAAIYMAAAGHQKTEPTPDKPKHVHKSEHTSDKPKHVHKRHSHKHGKQVANNPPVKSHEHHKTEPAPDKPKHVHKRHSH